MAIPASEVGGLVSSLAGIGRNVSAKDWIATGLGAGALGMEATKVIVKGIVEKKIKNELAQQLAERTNPWAAEVPVIEWGLVAITGLEFLLGLGDATKGQEFDNGRSKLDLPKRDLEEKGFPDSRWEGPASKEYAGQNKAQLDRVSTMRDQDQAMMDILAAEVDQLTEIRRAVAGIKDGLTACIFVALLIKAYGTEAGSLVFQKVVTIAAISGTLSAIGYMELFSGTETRPKVYKVVEKYQEMITAMTAFLSPSRVAPPAGVASAQKSYVSDFSSGSGSVGMADTSTPAGMATPTRPLIAPSLSELIQLSGQPQSVLPSLTQLSQMSGQAGSTGRVPQPASTTRRGQASAPAPAKDVTSTGETEGAAAGSEATERTPVEVAAAGAEHATEPSRAQ